MKHRRFWQENPRTPFRSICHSLRNFRSSCPNVFGVLMGTTFRIGNFSPTSMADPSAKSVSVPEHLNTMLYPSIFTIRTFDIWDDIKFAGLDCQPSDESPRKFFSFGRPFWGASFAVGATWRKVSKLAAEKLNRLGDGLPQLSQCISFFILEQTMNAA